MGYTYQKASTMYLVSAIGFNSFVSQNRSLQL